MASIAIIDCGAGNLHSVRKAVVRQAPVGAEISVIRAGDALADATHIVLPGVGAFGDCMQGLNALPGMRAALEQAVLVQKKPFLGICVGMQMLFARGHEHGVHEGLGWFQGEVTRLVPNDPALRIPHMGWNTLRVQHAGAPLLRGVGADVFVYFVHSYAATGCNGDEVIATVDYGGDVVALIGRENIWGTQFHPEKSQAVGLQILTNFLDS